MLYSLVDFRENQTIEKQLIFCGFILPLFIRFDGWKKSIHSFLYRNVEYDSINNGWRNENQFNGSNIMNFF